MRLSLEKIESLQEGHYKVRRTTKHFKGTYQSTSEEHFGTVASLEGRSDFQQAAQPIHEVHPKQRRTTRPAKQQMVMSLKDIQEHHQKLERMLQALTFLENGAKGGNQTQNLGERAYGDDWEDFIGASSTNEIEEELMRNQQQYEDLRKFLSAGLESLQGRLSIEAALRVRVEMVGLRNQDIRQLEFFMLAQPYVSWEITEFALKEIQRLEERQILDSALRAHRKNGPSGSRAKGSVLVEVQEALGGGLYEIDESTLVHAPLRITQQVQALGKDTTEYQGWILEDVVQEKDCICHYCREVFPEKSMVSCHYRHRRRIPDTLEEGDRMLVEKIFLPNRLPEPAQYKQFLRYIIETNPYRHNEPDGKCYFRCHRKFCRGCLADLKESGLFDESSECCAYCQGVCNCSRCIQNDGILKLAAVFVINGGDLLRLRKESSFVRLLTAESAHASRSTQTEQTDAFTQPFKRLKQQ